VGRHARSLEKLGIPTVAAAGANVVQYATGYDFLYNNGMPIRYIGVPFPVGGQPKPVHHRYAFEANDRVSGNPIMQAIISGLTRPLTDNEKTFGDPLATAPEPRLLLPDTEDNLQRLFKDKDWTDYLPITLPTEPRVAAMLEATSHKPDEVVKIITWPGGSRALTVEKVAVCAVMSGARPEYFPLILTLATGVPMGNSTTSMANMIVVNGPIRNQLKMNYGGNAMGPHNEVNATVGRAFTILSKTAGNLHAGVTTWSSLGNSLQYNNICIAENEESLPEGWDPLHVQLGLKRTDSAVTVGTGWSYVSSVGEAQISYPPQMLIRDYMRSLSGLGATIIMDPTVAALLRDAQGFKTKTELSAWLSQNVEKTVASYFGNGLIATGRGTASLILQGLEPYTSWIKNPPETLIKPFDLKSIQVVVVGGKTQTTWFVTDQRFGRSGLVDFWR
jgi:hypothetical protein